MRESTQAPPTRGRAAAKGLLLVVLLLLVTDASIILDVPVLRQVLGFLFFTTVPGFLILSLFKGNRFGLTERVVLSVGLSVSFLMFGGLLINWGLFGLGYTTPLSLKPLVISFSAFLVVLAGVVYKINKEAFLFSPSGFKLDTTGKLFLLLPLIFPLLSIWGTHQINTTGNNAILLLLLSLITLYVIVIALLRRKVPGGAYPAMLFMISLSLLLMAALRTNHILGVDAHAEYLLFQLTAGEQYWHVSPIPSNLDSSLSISLLPTIYQSLVNINPERLFMLLYALIPSILPIVVYVISRKYVGDFYAFLASILFMSQEIFVFSATNGRTVIAMLFYALIIMVLFHNDATLFSRRALSITFMASMIISHYSTSFIFLFLLFLTWVGVQIILKVKPGKKEPPHMSESHVQSTAPEDNNQSRGMGTVIIYGQNISLAMAVLFFAMLFVWFSYVAGAAFESGVLFIYDKLKGMGEFFVLESRGGGATLLGMGFGAKVVPVKIHLIFSWLTTVFIGIGILATITKFRQMVSFPGQKEKRSNMLQDKFDMEYLILSIVSVLMLAASLALPFVLKGYPVDRFYQTMLTPLSVFFVVGCVTAARLVKIRPRYWLILILLLLIPHFMNNTGLTYQIFGVPRTILLNSEGAQYDWLYIRDEDSSAAKWLARYAPLDEKTPAFSDRLSVNILMSQGLIRYEFTEHWGSLGQAIFEYFYLGYYNLSTGKLRGWAGAEEVISEVEWLEPYIEAKRLIYTNGGAEILW